MKIVVLFQIRTGDGNPERTKQNRRPAWASKKEWEFPQWQMLMVTLRRVYMSQSAEPFRIDSSQSAQVFSKFGSIPASLLSHVESIPKKNEPSRSEAIIVDGWCSGSFLRLDPSSPCADSWCWLEFQGAGRLHHDDLKGAAAPFPHCVAVMNDLEPAGSSN